MTRATFSFKGLNQHIHEPVNCLTHLLGTFLSCIGMVMLLHQSWGEPLYFASFILYGFSSTSLYLASSLFHGLKVTQKRRRLLLRLDHAGIFAMIAGCYSPLALTTLESYSPALGWSFFIAVWCMALLGMTLRLKYLDAPRWLSTGVYVLLGWAGLLILEPLNYVLPFGALFFMFLGGAFYSVGAVVFLFKRPNLYPGVLGHHELWHLFVLAGSFSHFWMIYFYLTP
ncbi:MAG: PAQR family membrane homeostasis protein TrhA [Trueperaceae bacterium]